MTTIEHPRVDPLDDLPIEEDDVTATELHERLKELVRVGLAWRLGDQALVIGDIFVASGRRQVSPDVLVRFGAHPGERSRYLVDVEGVPDVTIEILSAVNHTTTGLIKQQEKRDLFGAIGVSEHIEIDPLTSTIQVWSSREGLSQSVYVGKEWRCAALYVTFRFDVDGFAATDDDGQVFVEATASLSQFRAERDEAKSERDQAKSERDQAAAERDRLRILLERHGIDPG